MKQVHSYRQIEEANQERWDSTTAEGKVSKMEWFENLEIQQRIEAISTIATENIPLVMCIKDDIKKLKKNTVKLMRSTRNALQIKNKSP